MSNQKSFEKLSWHYLKSEVLKHKKSLLLAHLAALSAVLLSVPIPLMMPLLVDEVLLNQPGVVTDIFASFVPKNWVGPVGLILGLFVVVAILRLLATGLTVIQSHYFAVIGNNINFQIRQRILDHLPLVTLKEYEGIGSSGLSSRCIVDVETIDGFISQTLSSFIVGTLTILGTAVILLLIDWKLGLTILLCNPVMIIFTRKFSLKIKTLTENENSAFEAFQLSLVETLDSIKQVKVARKEQSYFSRVTEAAVNLKDCAIQAQWKTEAITQISFTAYLLSFEVFRAIAMLMVVFSGLSVGEIFAIFAYLWFMMGPIQELLGMQYAYYSATTAMDRLNEVFALKRENQYPALIDPFNTNRTTKVEFKDVSFSYVEGHKTLDKVNLTLEAGKKTALVAVSGGGKSTLVQLLLGLYEKQSGEILFDDVPINQIGYQRVREKVSTVLQEPILFNASVRENLVMGDSSIDDEAIWEALKKAELFDEVSAMDEQLNSEVGRSGVRLSGGQRQRLAIARMLLSDPKVVILDEATSALDAATESRLFHNIEEFLSERTVLIIAHRMSAIKLADKVYVLDDGVVNQSGSHSELTKEKGLYQSLYSHQVV